MQNPNSIYSLWYKGSISPIKGLYTRLVEIIRCLANCADLGVGLRPEYEAMVKRNFAKYFAELVAQCLAIRTFIG